MSEIKDLFTVNDYCSGLKLPTLHPLVSVVDVSEGTWPVLDKVQAVRYHFYAVFLKQGQDCTIRYGRETYDFQDGTLVFIGPGQVVNIENIDPDIKPSGYALLFHPDLLRGTILGNNINNYSFFSYELFEALHISQKERQIVLDCFDKIQFELTQGIDRHSKTVIVSNIELFMNYCRRFYDRQFITRENVNRGTIEKFEKLLNDYFSSSKPQIFGIPNVSYFANELNLSANYFGDLIKKGTGNSAQELIQNKLLEIAKDQMFDPSLSISEIAYGLGFKYPQHFSRFFKSQLGFSPSEYRSQN